MPCVQPRWTPIKWKVAALVCRDVKPSNCLLKPAPRTEFDTRGWELKLADFGAACLSGSGSQPGSPLVCDPSAPAMPAPCVGALSHAAPEVVAESAAHHTSADVWAFGVLLWELYTGRLQLRTFMDPQPACFAYLLMVVGCACLGPISQSYEEMGQLLSAPWCCEPATVANHVLPVVACVW